MDDNQRAWLADYLKSDDVEQEHDLLINWIDKLLYQAGVEERQADARAVCPRCTAGDRLEYRPGVNPDLGDWLHIFRGLAQAENYLPCYAASIWERGQAESERA